MIRIIKVLNEEVDRIGDPIKTEENLHKSHWEGHIMRKVRWGVLSTARIGTEKVIRAMQLGEYCTVIAIASRRLEKAQAAARQLGIKKAY